MARWILGLDGGGTKTHALALDTQGTIVGEGFGGPCNVAAVAPQDALTAALAAADAALGQAALSRGDVSAICAAVAGYSQAPRRSLLADGLQLVFPQAKVDVQPDYAAALWGATEGEPGIVVIAGTGSVAYGENAQGQSHRAGAYGYLLDDGGSGYGVGRSAIAAALHAWDGTGEATSLTERLREATGYSMFVDMVSAVYGGSLDRLAIARLAPLVAAAAREEHDPVAVAIFMRAGGTLARLASAVLSRLFPDATIRVPVATVGSLWNAGEPLTEVFDRSLFRFAPAAERVFPRRGPAHGAALHALPKA